MKTNPTDQEKEQGYRMCDCGGVELLQAGYEIPLHSCSLCKLWVCDRDKFFKTSDGVRALSK